MPAGDRTGPWGGGSRTGRGLGYCSGSLHPGYMTPGPGLGFGGGLGAGWGRGGGGLGRGMGMGRGRGFRHFGRGRFWGYPYPPAAPYGYPPAGPQDPAGAEESLLARRAEYFEEELARIKERLEELKKSQDEKADEK